MECDIIISALFKGGGAESAHHEKDFDLKLTFYDDTDLTLQNLALNVEKLP